MWLISSMAVICVRLSGNNDSVGRMSAGYSRGSVICVQQEPTLSYI